MSLAFSSNWYPILSSSLARSEQSQTSSYPNTRYNIYSSQLPTTWSITKNYSSSFLSTSLSISFHTSFPRHLPAPNNVRPIQHGIRMNVPYGTPPIPYYPPLPRKNRENKKTQQDSRNTKSSNITNDTGITTSTTTTHIDIDTKQQISQDDDSQIQVSLSQDEDQDNHVDNNDKPIFNVPLVQLDQDFMPPSHSSSTSSFQTKPQNQAIRTTIPPMPRIPNLPKPNTLTRPPAAHLTHRVTVNKNKDKMNVPRKFAIYWNRQIYNWWAHFNRIYLYNYLEIPTIRLSRTVSRATVWKPYDRTNPINNNVLYVGEEIDQDEVISKYKVLPTSPEEVPPSNILLDAQGNISTNSSAKSVESELLAASPFTYSADSNDVPLDKNVSMNMFDSDDQLMRTDSILWDNQLNTYFVSLRYVAETPWDVVMYKLRQEMARQYVDEHVLPELDAIDKHLSPQDKRKRIEMGVEFAKKLLRCGGPFDSLIYDKMIEGEIVELTGEEIAFTSRVRKIVSSVDTSDRVEVFKALYRVQEIFYALNMDAIRFDEPRVFQHVFLDSPKANRDSYEIILRNIIQEFFFVETLWIPTYNALTNTEGTVLKAYGTPLNLDMVGFVYELLIDIVEGSYFRYSRKKKMTSSFQKDRNAHCTEILTEFFTRLEAQQRTAIGKYWNTRFIDPKLERKPRRWEGDDKLKSYVQSIDPNPATDRNFNIAFNHVPVKVDVDTKWLDGPNIILHRFCPEDKKREEELGNAFEDPERDENKTRKLKTTLPQEFEMDEELYEEEDTVVGGYVESGDDDEDDIDIEDEDEVDEEVDGVVTSVQFDTALAEDDEEYFEDEFADEEEEEEEDANYYEDIYEDENSEPEEEDDDDDDVHDYDSGSDVDDSLSSDGGEARP